MKGEESLAIVPAIIEGHRHSTGSHHPAYSPEYTRDNRRREETKRYFKYLACEVVGAKEIFICGPGQMKKHFAKFLMRKPHGDRVAIEIDTTSSRISLNQIRAKIRPHIEFAAG